MPSSCHAHPFMVHFSPGHSRSKSARAGGYFEHPVFSCSIDSDPLAYSLISKRHKSTAMSLLFSLSQQGIDSVRPKQCGTCIQPMRCKCIWSTALAGVCAKLLPDWSANPKLVRGHLWKA